MPSREPRNPFYWLLMAASLLFVITALAYAVVPTLEQKAAQAGQAPPPSAFRDALRTDGWRWLLFQVAAMIVFGILSMVLDHRRSLQKDRAAATIPPAGNDSAPS